VLDMHLAKANNNTADIIGMHRVSGIGVARGGAKRAMVPPNFWKIVILCFERRFSKENSVICLKSNILPPPISGLATPMVSSMYYSNKLKHR